MADTEKTRRKDPHDWNPLANYRFLHEKHLQEHPLVLPESRLNTFVVRTPEAPYDVIVVEGLVLCSNGIHMYVYKVGDTHRSPAHRVRMNIYRYNAWFPGGHNVLRYDNMHRGNENVYHRHSFDPATGEEVEYREMAREDFPVMHQILDELFELFPPQVRG